jgi:Amt family ammonium transporter
MINLARWASVGLLTAAVWLTASVCSAWADETPAASAAAASSAAPGAADSAAASTSSTETSGAASAPTAPFLLAMDKISAGDTAWMLTSTALVLMMSVPGLALFYGGMVRKKNVLATLMQTFAIVCVVTLLWWAIGYSWAFTPGSAFLGGSSRAFFNGMTVLHDSNQVSVSHLALTIPETVYAMFQLTFAAITPALICGSFAERMKFSAMLIFMVVWVLAVYTPIAHMVWEPSGWLNAAGVLDYAGGTVVHINAGIAGLATCLVLGKRLGYGRETMAPYNLTYTMIGASLLWVGWFGFNAGSAVAADGRAGMAMAVTQIATAAAALGWMFAEWITKGKPSVLGIASGAVAGLVAITPASGFVGPSPAVVIGILAGVLCFISATSLKHVLGYDDSLDAFGVHGIGGIIGALLTGAFVSKEISGVDGSVLIQLKGVAVTLIYGFVVSYVVLKIIDATIGLRVTEEQEREGLDISMHGESIE